MRHSLGRPGPPRSLEHDDHARISDQEAVVVAERGALDAARSALAVALQVLDDDLRRLLCGRCALKCEPKEVHTQQTGLRLVVPGEDRLVADHHASRVRSHLRSPHPPGSRDQHRHRRSHLGYLDPGAGEPGVRFVRRRGMPLEDLGLVGISIRVLGEEHAVIEDLGEGVAHG